MSIQGMRIKELREKKGMTQSELGKAIGTTKQNIFNVVTHITGFS